MRCEQRDLQLSAIESQGSFTKKFDRSYPPPPYARPDNSKRRDVDAIRSISAMPYREEAFQKAGAKT
jgi:hypothetical protein